MIINKVFVIGAGQMGSGIAQVAAQAGLEVILYDLAQEYTQKGYGSISKNLAKNVEKGKMDQESMAKVLKQITTSTNLQDAQSADLIIEAAIENLELKGQIFKELDTLCLPETIFATNTSSLPITELAAFTSRPERFIGMHFMNPVPVMKLVEVIRGLATSQEVFELIHELSIGMGKVPVEVSDGPGFVSNRVLLPMINEAVYCLYEGVAAVEGIDEVMKLGMNHPMGPLALADLIGLDTCLAIMETLHDGFKDSKYRPCPLLKKYVKAGWLGRKSGRGFYQYN